MQLIGSSQFNLVNNNNDQAPIEGSQQSTFGGNLNPEICKMFLQLVQSNNTSQHQNLQPPNNMNNQGDHQAALQKMLYEYMQLQNSNMNTQNQHFQSNNNMNNQNQNQNFQPNMDNMTDYGSEASGSSMNQEQQFQSNKIYACIEKKVNEYTGFPYYEPLENILQDDVKELARSYQWIYYLNKEQRTFLDSKLKIHGQGFYVYLGCWQDLANGYSI